MEASLPQAFEEAIYGETRGAREAFAEYVIRMEQAMKELERKEVKIHDLVVGYVMYRQANLSTAQEDQMMT